MDSGAFCAIVSRWAEFLLLFILPRLGCKAPELRQLQTKQQYPCSGLGPLVLTAEPLPQQM